MLEKRWAAVPAQTFMSDGTAGGKLTVVNAALFKVKQVVILQSSTQSPSDAYEVKRIEDKNTIYVGPIKGNIDTRSDISAFLVSDGASISANEQKRSSIPLEEFTRAVYEEEPIVAQRVIAVDEIGQLRDQDNPTPIKSGTWWDEADITRDGDDDIIKVEFNKLNSLVETVDLEYNGEKSIIKVIKS